MPEFLQRLIDQIRSRWEQLPLPWRILSVGVVAAVVLSFVLSIWWFQRGDYITLYHGLTPEDKSTIVFALKQQGLDYQIEADEVLVKVEDVDEARKITSLARLSTGVGMFGTKPLQREGTRGYKILERGTLSMMSEAEFRELRRQALEGELSLTLRTFTGVEEADVKLSIPEREPFVRDQEDPKASVILKLSPQEFMDRGFDVNTIKSMQRLVAHSTSGLKPENVHIVDTTSVYDSEVLIKPTKTAADRGLEYLEIKEQAEEHYTKKLRNAVKQFSDKVRVAGVEVDVDLKESKTVKEEFAPVLEDAGLARSEMVERESFEGEGTLPGGEPGVESNLFPPEYETYSSTGPSTYDRSKTIRNYDTSSRSKGY